MELSNREFWSAVLGDRFAEFKTAAERGLLPQRSRPLAVRSGVQTTTPVQKPANRFGDYAMFMGVT